MFKTNIMNNFFIDTGPAPEGGYVPLFRWEDSTNNSN